MDTKITGRDWVVTVTRARGDDWGDLFDDDTGDQLNSPQTVTVALFAQDSTVVPSRIEISGQRRISSSGRLAGAWSLAADVRSLAVGPLWLVDAVAAARKAVAEDGQRKASTQS
jgi:hypothetical protein